MLLSNVCTQIRREKNLGDRKKSVACVCDANVVLLFSDTK